MRKEGPMTIKMPDETPEQAAERRLREEYPGIYFNHVVTRKCEDDWNVEFFEKDSITVFVQNIKPKIVQEIESVYRRATAKYKRQELNKGTTNASEVARGLASNDVWKTAHAYDISREEIQEILKYLSK